MHVQPYKSHRHIAALLLQSLSSVGRHLHWLAGRDLPFFGLDLLAELLLAHFPSNVQQHVLLSSMLKVSYKASSKKQAC